MMMNALFLAVAVVVILTMVPYLVRAAVGPSVFDRLIGLNALGTKVAVLLVLTGLLYGRAELFIDLALALFMLNLVATLLIARYVREQYNGRRGGQ